MDCIEICYTGYIHGTQRMKPIDFVVPLNFPLIPPTDPHFSFLVSCLDKYGMDCLKIWYIMVIHGAQRMNPTLLTFLLVPP